MCNYQVQKALHLHEAKKVKKFQFGEYAVMPKLDGWYCYIDFIGGKWDVLRSRVGRDIPSLAHLSRVFPSSQVFANNCRLLFEVTIPNTPFHITNGILNRKSELATEAVLNLHDYILLDSPELHFPTRYMAVVNTGIHLKQWFKENLEVVPLLVPVCKTEDQAQQLFQDVTSRGGEGIILKDLNSGYHFGKRNNTLMKIKEEVSKDLLVVGMVEGTGKYLGTLGALQVQTKSGVVIEVSGMTDLERNSWWITPDCIIGKVVEVKAMKELPNDMLREPRFKAVRFDKTELDID